MGVGLDVTRGRVVEGLWNGNGPTYDVGCFLGVHFLRRIYANIEYPYVEHCLQGSQMKSLDDHIMEIIREKPKCTSGEIKDELKVRDVKVAPRTVDGHIRKLRELGVIVAVLHPMKLVPAYIPADRYKEWTEVKFQERKIHSDDLKKEVIKPWLEALQPAILHENGSLGHLHFSGFGSLRRSILFKDVWNHVDPELRYGWDEFMERLNDLRDKSGKVLSVIQREIEKILSGKGGIWAEIEKRTGLEISKEFGYATVDPGLVRLVLNEALRRSQGY